MLLGGAQILIDGGRLVFERPQGDLAMVSALWLLLPEATRTRLWPTSFAFSRELEFDSEVLFDTVTRVVHRGFFGAPLAA